MGQTSAGVTWPVWTRAGAWDDCCDELCKHKKRSKHLWARLWLVYYKCDVDHRLREWPCHTTQVTLHNQRGS